MFADCFCAVHTHQLEFANMSLPTLVCRVKAALGNTLDVVVSTHVCNRSQQVTNTLTCNYSDTLYPRQNVQMLRLNVHVEFGCVQSVQVL